MNYITKSDFVDAVIDCLPVLIADLDQGTILYTTQALEKIFGYQVRGDLVGKNVDDLVPLNVRPTHALHRKRYADNPELRAMGMGMPLKGMRKDKTLFPVAVSLAAAVINGQRCVIAAVMDLTEKPHTEVIVEER